jgi:hypothetical protein
MGTGRANQYLGKTVPGQITAIREIGLWKTQAFWARMCPMSEVCDGLNLGMLPAASSVSSCMAQASSGNAPSARGITHGGHMQTRHRQFGYAQHPDGT